MNYREYYKALGGLFPGRKFGAYPDAFFVRPYRTSTGLPAGLESASDANSGLRPDKALKTLSAAIDKVTSGRGQVVYVLSSSNTAGETSDDLSAALTISKSGFAIVGVNSGNEVAQRSRIQQLSTATGLSPMVTFSGHNNYIEGLHFFQGVDDATSLINVLVSGQRNYFKNCHFGGIGNATQTASGARSLKVTGSENVFENCTIGLDTITRDGADQGEIELSGGATRNLFKNCRIIGYTSSAAYTPVIVPVNGIDRWNEFRDCAFINMPTGDAAGTTADEVFAVTGGGSPDGILLVTGASYKVGFTEWEKDTVSGKVMVTVPAASATGATAVDAS